MGLLPDLAHAQVSATRLGYSLEAFLEALPLERVEQLHPNPGVVRAGSSVELAYPSPSVALVMVLVTTGLRNPAVHIPPGFLLDIWTKRSSDGPRQTDTLFGHTLGRRAKHEHVPLPGVELEFCLTHNEVAGCTQVVQKGSFIPL